MRAPPPKTSILQSGPKGNPIGAAGVRDAITEELNWLVKRDNSIHAAGLYYHEGDLIAYDTYVDLVDEAEQEAFYEDLGLRDDVLAFMEASYKVANKERHREPKTELGRELEMDVTAIRLTLGKRRYIGIVPIFKEHSYFLVVTVLDREGSRSRKRNFVRYVDHLYREDLIEVRRRITEILTQAAADK